MQREPIGQHAHRRWRRWLLACAVAALALVAWHSASRDAEPVQQLEPAAASTASTAAPAAPPTLESARQTVPQPAPRYAAAPAAAARTVAAPSDPVEMEICGFGMVKLAADDPYQLQRVPPALRKAALEGVDALMLESSDEQVRAAALLIGARSPRDDARERADRLARLAVGSQDAAVYAMALEACKGWGAADGGACQLLNRAQWVRLDPDNVLPWLELAAEAQDRSEPEAEGEAMQRAAHARRSDAYDGLLPRLVERTLGSDAPPLQRTLALSASWSVQTVWALSRPSHAYSYCLSNAALGAAERQHSCEAIAETLAQRSLSLADLGVGLAIGKGLGWSVERLRALQQVNDAISEISGLQTIGLDLSCDGVARMQEWLRRLDARGELLALREVLARGGRSAVSGKRAGSQ